MRLLSFFYVSCFVCFRLGTARRVDSLQQLLHKQADDTSKVNTLNELSYVYYQTVVYDSELYYAQQALNLSQKLNLEKRDGCFIKNIGSASDDIGNNRCLYIITDVL